MYKYGEQLIKIRNRLNISRREAAKQADISEAHFRSIEVGTRPCTVKIIKKLSKAFEIKEPKLMYAWIEEHMEGLNLPSYKLRKVPLISWVKAGEFAEAEDPFSLGHGEDWIWTQTEGANVFALKVQGDSMEPEFRDGEIIIINPHIAWNNGSFVIVKNGNDAKFEQLKKKGDIWILHPINSK